MAQLETTLEAIGLSRATDDAAEHPCLHIWATPDLTPEDAQALAAAFRATHYWPREGMTRFSLVRRDAYPGDDQADRGVRLAELLGPLLPDLKAEHG